MSDENLATVRAAWRAWSERGIEGAIESAAADQIAYAFPGWVGTLEQRGPEGLRAMLAEWNEAFTDYAMELLEARQADDDRVVALILQSGTSKSSGVAISQRIGAVYTDFREDGTIGEVRFYPSWHQALDAGGIEEISPDATNVEIMRAGWATYAEHGVDGIVELFAVDCVCEDFPEMPDRASYRGRAGVRRRDEHFREVWGDLTIEAVEFIDAGENLVITLTSIRGHGEGSGAPVDAPTAFLSEFRDGKVISDRAFTTRGEALAAAGIAP